MAKKRVAVFGWADSVHVRRWVTGLAARGFEIKLISLGGHPVETVDTWIFPRTRRLNYLLYAHRAARQAANFQPDLVHVHYALGFGLWGLLTGHRPTLVSVWGSDVVDRPSSLPMRMLIRRVLRKADGISATGEFLRKVTTQLLPEAASKITVIPFGVDVPEIPPSFPEEESIRICFIKSHRRASGADVLIEAMRKVAGAIPSLRLSMAGSGEMTGQLRRMVSDYGLDRTVDFIGRLEHDAIGAFLGRHHIMVMPSRREAFGVAALEASACGRPVVASDISGIPEVVRDGKTGILVPSEDADALAEAIIRLAGDSELREKMGRNGFEFVRETYRWEKSLDMMSDLYERLIDEN